MSGHGKCSKCDKEVIRCELDPMVIEDQRPGLYFRGAIVCCPHCTTILGISTAMLRMADHIVQEVTKLIQERAG